MPDASDDRPRSKVARLIDEYGLEGAGDELVRRWTAEGSERSSLRELAGWFNRRLLGEAMRAADLRAADPDVASTHRRLVGDDVSDGVRTQTRTELASNGVDVDALLDDFVTYQAVRHYLTNYRNVAYQTPDDEEKLENDLDTIQRLTTRARTVVEDRIEQSVRAGRLSDGDFEVLLEARVFCRACGTQATVAELFEQRGCDCDRRTGP